MDWFDWAKEHLARWKAGGKAVRRPFSPLAQKVLDSSFNEARVLHHDYIGAEHLLLGLMELREGFVPRVFSAVALDEASLRAEVQKYAGECAVKVPWGSLPFTPRLKSIVQNAKLESQARKQERVEPEDLLLGLLRETGGLPVKLFEQFGVDIERLKTHLLTVVNAPIA